ncbi:hypothetical protein BD310DRAFT_799430, partial [Dichomitus squalens]
VAGARWSVRARKPANPNTNYERAIREEQQRNQARPYFAGISSTGPQNHELPTNLASAFRSTYGEHWRAALEEELQSLRENCVYETVPTPSGVKPISSKPVFRVKHDKNG